MTMRTALATLLLLCSPGLLRAQTGYDYLAPFEGVRWRGVTTQCRLDGVWYELIELDGRAAQEVLDFCAQTWGPDRARKRFGEDLVEALARMGAPPGERMSLRLRDLDGSNDRTVSRAMTSENRQSVRRILNGDDSEEVGPLPSSPPRELPVLGRALAELDPRYAFLASLTPGSERRDRRIALDLALQDLVQLQAEMEERHSYLGLAGVDVDAAFDALVAGLARLGPDVSVHTFGLGLMRLLALFGDGHTGAGGAGSLRSFARPGYAPWLLADTTGGLVALREDRSSFVDPEHPFLVAIDGIAVDEWIRAAEPYAALGSPQARRRQALRNLRYIAQLRVDLGREPSSGVVLTLRGAAGETSELSLPLEERRAPVYGTWPRTEDRLLDGEVGYLRLAEMSDEPAFLARLRDSMEGFRETRGLVIDLRSNSGGSRDALRTLLPYFLGEGAAPTVVNAARPRQPEESLADRSLRPVESDDWTAPERAAVDEFLRSFAPDWEPGPAFGPWHVMLVDASSAPFAYRAPVVLLCDSDCFSATDVFLGAFAELPQVTLVGTPSAGGSGRSQSVRLRSSGMVVSLSSMASFRPNGNRYDGKGVEVDRLLLPAPSDLLGGTDTVLDAALALLRR